MVKKAENLGQMMKMNEKSKKEQIPLVEHIASAPDASDDTLELASASRILRNASSGITTGWILLRLCWSACPVIVHVRCTSVCGRGQCSNSISYSTNTFSTLPLIIEYTVPAHAVSLQTPAVENNAPAPEVSSAPLNNITAVPVASHPVLRQNDCRDTSVSHREKTFLTEAGGKLLDTCVRKSASRLGTNGVVRAPKQPNTRRSCRVGWRKLRCGAWIKFVTVREACAVLRQHHDHKSATLQWEQAQSLFNTLEDWRTSSTLLGPWFSKCRVHYVCKSVFFFFREDNCLKHNFISS